MTRATTGGKIIVRPRASHGWTMVTARFRWEMHFQTRTRALQFARAYAKLNPPAVLQVLGEAGELEAEETFEAPLHGGSAPDGPARPRLAKPG
jgi:hypothetical protein